ncbi:MAG: hypothetical protein EOO11_13495 [Chitinophagaceae bacterium]|nr:MAG: hypothetical protein EOO11_13495 [Chitinophagaceae bacterium]
MGAHLPHPCPCLVSLHPHAQLIMESVAIQTGRRSALGLAAAAVPALSGLTAAFAFRGYIGPLSLSFILGVAALPFSAQAVPVRGFSRMAVLAALLFLGLSLLLPVRTLLFYGAGAVLACGAGLLGYRSRLLTLWNWVLISPMFAYLANAFSFPIRMQLASCCGKLLSAVAVPVAISGNVIEDSRGRFSIDPGCMGLNMLTASLLLGVLLLGYFERRSGRGISVRGLALYITVLLLLNVLSNLVRILVLVWCVWLPGTLLHELTGLVCLALYVGLPALWLARRLVQGSAVQRPVSYACAGQRARRIFLLLCMLCTIASVGGCRRPHRCLSRQHLLARRAETHRRTAPRIRQVCAGLL